MKHFRSFNLLALFLGTGLMTSCSDPLIIEKLEQIVEIRESIAKEAVLLQELGKGDPGPALIALSEAKIALATEQKDFPGVISELEKIVEHLKAKTDRESALAGDDRRTQAGLGKLMIQAREAEVRLLRAKAKHGIK